jgi:hypothetical protein
MSYSAWSVVFGEVPTDTKWNLLGSNDDSFNDGTGIIDDAIIQRHLADESIGVEQLTSTLLPYKELGRDTLDSISDTLSVVFVPKRYLRVILSYVANANGTDSRFYFNGDDGAINYAEKYTASFSGPTDDPSKAWIDGEVGNTLADGSAFIIMDIFNPVSGDKIVNHFAAHQTALTAGTPPTPTQLVGMYNGSQISSIRAFFDTPVKVGSELIILGHN